MAFQYFDLQHLNSISDLCMTYSLNVHGSHVCSYSFYLRHGFAVVHCLVLAWFWRYLTGSLYIRNLSQSSIRPSVCLSSIVKTRSNPFLEPTSTKHCGYNVLPKETTGAFDRHIIHCTFMAFIFTLVCISFIWRIVLWSYDFSPSLHVTIRYMCDFSLSKKPTPIHGLMMFVMYYMQLSKIETVVNLTVDFRTKSNKYIFICSS